MVPETAMSIDFNFTKKPSYTYSLSGGHISGIDAIKQAIYKILQTERFYNSIYSWDYGLEIYDLYGHDPDLMQAELKRRISDALMQDDRITDVYDFKFDYQKGNLSAAFTVQTDAGEVVTTYDI